MTDLLPAYLNEMIERPLSSTATGLRLSIMRIQAELGQNLLQLLNGFYLLHMPVSNSERLVIQASGLGQYKLLNQGSIVSLSQPKDGDYLEEFASFTSYLNTAI